jgi:hypothetical protein
MFEICSFRRDALPREFLGGRSSHKTHLEYPLNSYSKVAAGSRIVRLLGEVQHVRFGGIQDMLSFPMRSSNEETCEIKSSLRVHNLVRTPEIPSAVGDVPSRAL